MEYDVVIIGAGAAGLMCAIESGKRGRKTLIIEHANKPGKKILISGGGRCNFTNINASPQHYLSANPHFPKSALARYSAQDFIGLVEKHRIAYHEKKLGQLFCNDSARQIVNMLLAECQNASVELKLNSQVLAVEKLEDFKITTNFGLINCHSLVLATGGLSIPKMGATDFGYKIAQKFGLQINQTNPGLVPFTFQKAELKNFEGLSGISVDALVSCNGKSFRENILITHRGVSGPAILQISSFWKPGDSIEINLLPDQDLNTLLIKNQDSSQELKTLLSEFLPKRLISRIFEVYLPNTPLNKLQGKERAIIADFFHGWTLLPGGTEGYRTAEVTTGGVDLNELSSKTFESKKVSGLYFIGELLDVTGWLGGYNFQWAWSSGYCAGQYV